MPATLSAIPSDSLAPSSSTRASITPPTRKSAIEPSLRDELQHVLQLVTEEGLTRLFVVQRHAELVAGRQACVDARLPMKGVSRVHAKFSVRNGTTYVRDADSRNGTYVNGRRIAVRTALACGDIVSLGPVQLRYRRLHPDELRKLRALSHATAYDALTGVFNRRYMEACLRSEMALAAQHGTALSFMLFDLDRFERVQHEHGHLAGNAVLRSFSTLLANNVGPDDVVARWGGKEFAVLVRGMPPEWALRSAERLRTLAARAVVVVPGTMLCFTTSCGVAHMNASTAHLQPEDLVLKAEMALQQAKRGGRNRVVAYDRNDRSHLSCTQLSVNRAERDGCQWTGSALRQQNEALP